MASFKKQITFNNVSIKALEKLDDLIGSKDNDRTWDSAGEVKKRIFDYAPIQQPPQVSKIENNCEIKFSITLELRIDHGTSNSRDKVKAMEEKIESAVGCWW